MYVDQTTIDDSDGVPAANKPVTRIMGQDSRDFDTYVRATGPVSLALCVLRSAVTAAARAD